MWKHAYVPVSYTRSKELLMRWMEMSAFTDAVFRTHPGNLPDDSAQVDTDAETLAQFARFATVHALLHPVRAELMRQAADTGRPLLRHLALSFPSDPVASRLTTQATLGDAAGLLVAPVFAPGQTNVSVYLPAPEPASLGGAAPRSEDATWVSLWTGDTFNVEAGGRWVVLHAPMGRPAVLYAQSSASATAFRAALVAAGLADPSTARVARSASASSLA
jgi:alpha-glucosidase